MQPAIVPQAYRLMSLPADFDYLDPDDRLAALYDAHVARDAESTPTEEAPKRVTPADAVRIARGHTGPPSIPIRFGPFV